MAKYGATGVHKIHSFFSTSGGVLSFYRDNASTQLAFGESDTGLDVKFYGDTVSAFALWDESADVMLFSSGAALALGGAFTASGTAAFTGSVTISDVNIALSASTGTQIGTASTQKLGFFGTTPRVQLAHTATTAQASTIAIAVLEGLQALGLMTATV